ncbi:Hypothetical protein FKW44_008299 [Caligus rogercresseyi]|uniref:Uncharacterized protein n=1 Tax=Caligus rogercresseyi TaxID=217165 RepID=A0A7T8KFX3_CALRO|nr:Hypothetical protein FKW44_008299 [Caligus rogercresseyi]
MEKIREKVIARIHAGDKPMDISRNFGLPGAQYIASRSSMTSLAAMSDEQGIVAG